MKKVLKPLLIAILVIILILLLYVAYVFIDYHRIEDNLVIEPQGEAVSSSVKTGTEYSITSWNIGFAAYLQDYGFFMDGGTESRAYSKESVLDNMQDISDKLNSYDSDFYFIQEVDFDSTRAYHVDEKQILIDNVASNGFSYAFAQNYDSPYLFYPILRPHGASKSGILTLSNATINSSLRRSLPIQTNVAKVLDLDRCYDINRISVDNGKELLLVNFHLSAYTTDPTIVTKQIEMLNQDLLTEYEKGNYIIAGGDFNKDLLGDSSLYFGITGLDYSWARSYPMELIPDGFSLIAPIDVNNPIPSCRNADGPYDKESQFQLTIDGFLVSDNIEVLWSEVIDNQFINSDHNPVRMSFKLK